MWSFGTQAMNTVMKNNRALLRKRHSFIEHRTNYLKTKLKYAEICGENFNHKTATPEELATIRKKFISKQKKRSIINLVLFTFIILICVLLTYEFYLYNEKNKPVVTEIIPSETKKAFRLLIKDGDEWMETGNFENAIFRYKSASKLIPNQFSVEYRICLGYAYLCRYENLECEQGKVALEQAISNFPNQEKLMDLKKYY